MKKLLIMASLFWPQKNGGGPAISVMNIVKAIAGKYDIYIISKNHEIGQSEPLEGVQTGWNELTFGKVYYRESCKLDYRTVIGLIHEIKPDIIYENSYFSYDDMVPVLMYKKQRPEVKVIVAPRGEFYPNRLKHAFVKKKFYNCILKVTGMIKDIYWHATGEQEAEYIKNFVNVDSSRIYNINNITAISRKTNCCKKDKGFLRLVFIARIHPMKNLRNGISFLKNIEENIIYDIYGSIEDNNYWNECLKEIKKLPKNIKVRYCGIAEHDEVAKILSEYHAFFMPQIGENYGHSIVEALCCGVPVIISDTTPWNDVDGIGGYVASLSDENAFACNIRKVCNMDFDEYNKLSDGAVNYIKEKLNFEEETKKYFDMFSVDS